jgi:hypothetical protein
MAKQLGRPRVSERLWRIIGLGADKPFPELKEKLALFGQFVGDWDILEARYPRPDGTEVKRKGEIHFRWILGGRAIQDVWMMHDKDTNKPIPAGTTIRFYDPNIDAWHSIWISPIQNVVQTFVARKVENQIVLEGNTKEGDPERWIFSQITPNSFRWHSEETHDKAKTWIITEEMRIQRRRAES